MAKQNKMAKELINPSNNSFELHLYRLEYYNNAKSITATFITSRLSNIQCHRIWLFISNARSTEDSSASQDIVVGKATRYGLDGPAIEFR